jgi:hypothetical protein
MSAEGHGIWARFLAKEETRTVTKQATREPTRKAAQIINGVTEKCPFKIDSRAILKFHSQTRSA